MFLRLNIRYTVIKLVCLVLCFKPFKIPFSISCSLYRDNERNKKIDLSCCKIQPTEISRFRCPLTTAPVRSAGFFFVPDGCNIAPGTDPASGPVKEDFRNFRQQFFGADSCCRQTTASCTFVRQRYSLCEAGPLPSRDPFLNYIWIPTEN